MNRNNQLILDFFVDIEHIEKIAITYCRCQLPYGMISSSIPIVLKEFLPVLENPITNIFINMFSSSRVVLDSPGGWFFPLFCIQLLKNSRDSNIPDELLISHWGYIVSICLDILSSDINLRVPLDMSDMSTLTVLLKNVLHTKASSVYISENSLPNITTALLASYLSSLDENTLHPNVFFIEINGVSPGDCSYFENSLCMVSDVCRFNTPLKML